MLSRRSGGRGVPQDDEAGVLLLVLLHVGKIPAQQLQKGVHLLLGALPVFGGKGVDGDSGDTGFFTMADDLPHHLGPGPMAHLSGEASGLGPATVPIHNNTDMPGQIFPLRRAALSFLHRFVPNLFYWTNDLRKQLIFRCFIGVV